LHERLFDVPAVQVAVWILLWLIDELAVAESLVSMSGIGSDVADAADTALPVFQFIASWLHEPVFDVPAVQVAFWVFDWLIVDVDVALVLPPPPLVLPPPPPLLLVSPP
jgi:hypothetical protein